jgi:VWFA-related protein
VALLARQQPPPFRAGTNFVRVDVYPTANGAIVPDLKAEDFEVLEDGVPQKIESFERVIVRGSAPEETKYEPNNIREANQIAESTPGRLFVIFLDTYFVNVAGSHDIRHPLVNLLNRLLGPDDMFAVMTPDMSALDLSFARKTDVIEDTLQKFWFWGQRDRLYPDDPVEQEYLVCYPDQNDPRHVAHEMILRRRERKVLDALTDLAVHLRGVREERKAVVVITGGWVLFGENQTLTAGSQPNIPQIGVTPDGRLTSDASASNLGYSKHNCERDRMSLSMIDDTRVFQNLFDVANRSNVSFYPVNPMGLEAFDKPIGDEPVPGEVQALVPSATRVPSGLSLVESRSQNLRTLAANTDGLAVVDTNAVDKGLRRIITDLSSYYLLGYASTNGKLDGKFRKITVRVKRSGVDVRARRGYRAPTQQEVDAGAMAEASPQTASAPLSAIQVALNGLAPVRPGIPIRTTLAAMPVMDGSSRALHLWALVELDASLSHQGASLGGGDAEFTLSDPDGTAINSAKATFPSGERTALADLGQVPASGEMLIKVRVAPTGGDLPYTDTIRVDAATASTMPILLRRGPSTGIRYVPTAVAQFGHSERIRVDVPVASGTTASSGEVLDRLGKTMSIPVHASTRVDGAQTWASAEASLAPLAAGDYLIRIALNAAGSTEQVVTAFRVTP